MTKYDSNSIETLRFPDAIRRNCAMYLGSSDEHGRWLIARELLDNGLDEALAGRNKSVALVECVDGSYWVLDNGAGIPQGVKTFELNLNGKVVKNKLPTMQAIFSELHTSGKFRGEAYKTSVGCFTGDTELRLLSGKITTFEKLYKRWTKNQKPIEIMTWDVSKDRVAYSKITHVQLSKFTKHLIEVNIGGKLVRCTPDHPFYVRTEDGIKCVEAKDLSIGDSLVSVSHGIEPDEVVDFVKNYNHQVCGIRRIELDKPEAVYGMTVAGYHTYFIEPGVLVKNTHGVGAKGTNATSDIFEVFTKFKNKWYTIKFERGLLKTPVKELAKAPKGPTGKPLLKGTAIHFKPDATIFSGKSNIDLRFAHQWAEITSYLTPGFTVLLVDKKGKKTKYYSEQGPTEYVSKILEQLKANAEDSRFEFKNELCDCVIAFSNADGLNIRGYTNGLINTQGGKHVDSVCTALLNTLKPYAKKKQVISAYDVKEGLVGIINMKLHKAEFSSQDKSRLTDLRAGKDFELLLEEQFKKFFAKNKALAGRLCDKASKLSELRTQFKASKKVVQALNQVKKKGMPSKYAPFDRRSKLQDRELLIVEGESASGGLREKRRPYQALLPLRGKIQNAMKAGDKALESEEVIAILGAIGYDPKAENPMSKLQVSKIICLADPDPDGCWSPDTKVLMCDGTRKTFKELASMWENTKEPVWVWSLDKHGNLHPAKAFDASVRCERDSYAVVTLDDGTKLKCTMNHPFAVNYSEQPFDKKSKGIKYVYAKNLRPGDSLMSAYFRHTNAVGEGCITRELTRPYLSVMQGGRTVPVHKLVMKDIHPKRYKQYEESNKGVIGGVTHIHHLDDNSLNNNPTNLKFLSREEHYGTHGSELALEHNVSIEHRELVASMNSDPKQIKQQRLGICARVYLGMKKIGLKYNRENFKRVCLVGDNGRASTFGAKYIPLHEVKDFMVGRVWLKPYDLVLKCDVPKAEYPTQKITKFVNFAYSVYEQHGRLDEDSYTKCRDLVKSIQRGVPKWNTIVPLLDTDDILGFVLQAKNNHKVVSVKFVKTKKRKPYYCLTVPKYGNFLVADDNGNGVCSSNCHINTLLLTLFYKYLPDLFNEGKVFVADVPELYAQYKDHLVMGDGITEIQTKLKAIKAPKSTPIHHIKGWGEIDASLMEVLAVDSNTRKLIQIKPIEHRDTVEFVACMNDNVDFRRKMLNLPE